MEPVGVELLGDEPDAVRAEALVIHAHLHLGGYYRPLDLDIIYTLAITVAGAGATPAEAAVARLSVQTKPSTDNMVQQLQRSE